MKPRVKNALKWKKPALWVTILAAVVCIVVIIACASDPVEDQEQETTIPGPMGMEFTVSGAIYTYPSTPLFTGYQDGGAWISRNAPYQIKVTEKGELLILYYLSNSIRGYEWLYLGKLQELTLTEGNFDRKFSGEYLSETFDPASFRQENQTAWELVLEEGLPDFADTSPEFYYVLQQNDGSIYYALGPGLGSEKSSLLSGLYQLKEGAEDYGLPSESKGYEIIESYVQQRAQQLEDQGVAIDEVKIQEFAMAASYTPADNYQSHLYLVRYRLCPADPEKAEKAGCILEDGWITEDTGGGNLYVAILWHEEMTQLDDGTMEDNSTCQLVGAIDDAAMKETYRDDYFGVDYGNVLKKMVHANLGSVMEAAKAADAERETQLNAFLKTELETYFTEKYGKTEYTICECWINNISSFHNGWECLIGAVWQKYERTDYGFCLQEEVIEGGWVEVLDNDGMLEIQSLELSSSQENTDGSWEMVEFTFSGAYGDNWENMLSSNGYIRIMETLGSRQEVVGGLFDRLAVGADPDACISAQPEIYEALIKLGSYTLEYCYTEFLEEHGDGLRGMLYAEVCQQIQSASGERYVLAYTDGADWFDQYRRTVEMLASRNDSETMAQVCPASWVLVQLLESNE